MKKQYISPLMHVESIMIQPVMAAASKFGTPDSTEPTKTVTTTEDEYDDEFCAKEFYHWGNENSDSEAFGLW